MARKIALFGGSLDPPGMHHCKIVIAVRGSCDKVIVVPCGSRPDRTAEYARSIHRARMVEMTFGRLAGVEIDFFDIDNATFTPAIELEERYYLQGEIWHVVGSDWIIGGREGKSVIQTDWRRGEELWQNSRFLIIERAGFGITTSDLPEHHGIFLMGLCGSSSQIRARVANGLSIGGLVVPEVESYIYEHGLYLKDSTGGS